MNGHWKAYIFDQSRSDQLPTVNLLTINCDARLSDYHQWDYLLLSNIKSKNNTFDGPLINPLMNRTIESSISMQLYKTGVICA